MVNPWLPPNGVSALSPPRLTTGDSSILTPPIPLDPPDPDFPPLGSVPPKSPRFSSQTGKPSRPATKSFTPKTVAVNPTTVQPSSTLPAANETSAPFSHSETFPQSNTPLPIINNPPPATSTPIDPTQSVPPPFPTNTPLLEKIRKLEDKSLKRLAPVTLSDKGIPRVLIPDSVFQKGAEIHKDFIICYFNGRPPPFNQVQSVVNHMWGKGKRVEIHTNPLSKSMLVRIPSDYLRQKILQKSVWYVGESMFHAVQWSSSVSASPPTLESIQIWAHLTGVPLDLRHQQGLSLVAGLVGEPKETDDFTKNLVSLTLSHVKVAVNLTKPLPSVVEFVRQSGEVVEVPVSYPWVPPTCSFCKELGHVARNCLQAPPPPKPSDVPAKKTQQTQSASQKGKNVPSETPTSKKPEKTTSSPSSTTFPQASTSSVPPNPDPPAPPIHSQPSKTPTQKNATPLASSHLLAVIQSPSKSPPDTFITLSKKTTF
ncbi:hypothetical protein F2Q69_00063187 [Brassica cretica]|uniref:DUF4283 domain-containing protein n=1 Tax=Brassica cretica TaxID=69181 RepID=A0A8S9RBN7_BRACR|nr:hypothetical protein F2Q69_00063187 [Brassica cretica]